MRQPRTRFLFVVFKFRSEHADRWTALTPTHQHILPCDVHLPTYTYTSVICDISYDTHNRSTR